MKRIKCSIASSDYLCYLGGSTNLRGLVGAPHHLAIVTINYACPRS